MMRTDEHIQGGRKDAGRNPCASAQDLRSGEGGGAHGRGRSADYTATVTNDLGWRGVVRALLRGIKDDHLSNGAGAVAFYMVLASFPAATFALSLLPYLPIPHLHEAIMALVREALPSGAATMFTTTVTSIVSRRSGGLLSFGLLFTMWSAANGMYALMQQLNVIYEVKEERPLWKGSAVALFLSAVFFVLVGCTLGLVVFGEWLQSWVGRWLGWSGPAAAAFVALRWAVIIGAILGSLALVYRFAPNVERPFRIVSPGSLSATVGLLLASFGLKLYVAHFGSYNAVYGSIGAVIVLLVWLLLVGWVILLGAELDEVLDRKADSSGSPRGGPVRHLAR
jgi:membrane protein